MKVDEKSQNLVLNNSLWVYSVLVMLVGGLYSSFIYLGGFIQSKHLLAFLVILVLDYLGTEIFRILNAIRHQIKASLVLIFRTGIWAIPPILMQNFSIDFILKSWIFSSTLGLVLGSLFLIQKFGSVRVVRPEKQWLSQGFKVALIFFINTLLAKLILYGNRFFIDFYLGKSDLGVYTFYFQMSNMSMVIVFNLFIVFELPMLIANSQDKKIIRRFVNRTSRISLLVSILLVPISYFLALYTGKKLIIDNFQVLLLLQVSATFFNMSLGYHYVLYSRQFDMKILRSSILSFVIFIPSLVALHFYPHLMIPILGVLLANITLFFVKRKVAHEHCY